MRRIAHTVAAVSTRSARFSSSARHGAALSVGRQQWPLVSSVSELVDVIRQGCWAAGITACFLPALFDRDRTAAASLTALGLVEVRLTRRHGRLTTELSRDLERIDSALRYAYRSNQPVSLTLGQPGISTSTHG